MEVQWTAELPPPTDDEIAQVERTLGVRFPADYLAILRVAHGGGPAPSSFTYVDPHLGPVGSGLHLLLTFVPGDGDSILAAVSSFRIDDRLPDGVVPFAMDGGGDLMAFDYRRSATPTVCYVATGAASDDEPDRHVYPLAASFTAFVAMLHEDEPLPDD